MIINIAVTKDKEAPEWDSDKILVKSAFPEVEVVAYASEKDLCINTIKGIVLCCIGGWNKVPNNITFNIEEIGKE
jgi:hypothetical protein